MRCKVLQRRRTYQPPKGAFVKSSAEFSHRPLIRIFIADRYEIVRAGIRTFLQREFDLEVVGEASRVEEVLSESQRTRPDVILMESWLSGSLESHIYKRLFETLPLVRIISFWGRGDNDAAFRGAVEVSACGYLQMDFRRTELVRAIRTVAKGGFYLGLAGAEQKFQQQDTVLCRSRLLALSPQERRIIVLMAKGDTNREIATKLVLSEKTVKNYINNMFAKLEIQRRTQAVVLYLQAQRDGMCQTVLIPG